MLQIILLQFSGSEFRDESHRAKSKVSAEGFLLEAPGESPRLADTTPWKSLHSLAAGCMAPIFCSHHHTSSVIKDPAASL